MMPESLKRIDKLRVERIDREKPKIDASPGRYNSLDVFWLPFDMPAKLRNII